MARTKNHPAAPSAAHAAPDPAPAPATAPRPDSPAAAVWAALSANPGATTAVIADAAGTGRPAARDALLAMEAAGTATRVKGGKPGIPDTWTLAEPTPPGADPAPEDEQDGQPGGSPDGADGDKAADGTGPGDTAQPRNPAPHDDDAQARASAPPDPTTGQPELHDDAPADDGHEDAVLGERDGRAVPDSGHPQDPDEGDSAADEDVAAADPGGEAGDTPDPALVTEITGRIAQIKAAADAAAIVLTGGGDLRGALAGLDEIAEQAAQARRSLKAATGGWKAPAARPGGLRDKVLAHLDEHPHGEFTPHEIHKVLSHSSGAIANALDTLVKLGDAELATEKPRRFRRADKPTAATPEADSANNAKDGTELAGAA
jgi:hypothetical protein